jgi:hypothetical protein
VYRDGKKLLFQAKSERAAEAFLAWFFAEHFQRHVLFGKTTPCAFHLEQHKCPGDVLKTRRWQPQDTCGFSKFIAKSGLRDLNVEYFAG